MLIFSYRSFIYWFMFLLKNSFMRTNDLIIDSISSFTFLRFNDTIKNKMKITMIFRKTILSNVLLNYAFLQENKNKNKNKT